MKKVNIEVRRTNQPSQYYYLDLTDDQVSLFEWLYDKLIIRTEGVSYQYVDDIDYEKIGDKNIFEQTEPNENDNIEDIEP